MRWFSGRGSSSTEAVLVPPQRERGAVSVTVSQTPRADVVQRWDELVTRTADSDVAQLSGWARIRADAGYRPQYLLAWHSGALVGGALVVVRQLPLLGPVGYVSNGPVVAEGAPRDAVVDALTEAMATATRRRLRCLFVQPPAGAHDISERLLARGFRPSDAGIAPSATVRLDLGPDLEELRGGLAKSNRKRSRSWADRGVTVRMGAAADVPVIAELLDSTASHRDFEAFSPEYLRTMYRVLAPSGHLVVFVAELDGSPVAFRVLTASGGVLKQRLSGTDRSPRALKEGVAAASVWHAVVWAKAHGFREYDFGGITVRSAVALERGEPIPAGPLDGIDRFKTSFGGRPMRYPQPVELISPPALRVGYEMARRSAVGDRLSEVAKRAMRGGRTGRRAPAAPSR